MRKRLTALAATVAGAAGRPAEAPAPTPQGAPQKPPTTVRSSLDLIAVDVQVIDREGTPVAGLGPDKFEVTINGRRRRVVSANLIESRSSSTLTPAERAAATGGPSNIPNVAAVVFISIDCPSFGPRASPYWMGAPRDFLQKAPGAGQ